MTEFKRINQQLSVFGQISKNDLLAAQQQGFKTVVNNRPDNESEEQISNAELEQYAKELDLTYFYLPIAPAGISDQEAQQFEQIFNQQTGPLLAFCRTGNRSTRLWALAQSGTTDSDSLIQQAQTAGYDISSLRERLDAKS